MDASESFERTETSLKALMQTLHTVLKSVGAEDVALHLPWRPLWDPGADGHNESIADLGDDKAEAYLQAYSIAFQLLNTAEENATAQHRRALEDARRLIHESGSWDHAFARADAAGLSASEQADILAQVRIEPVLTAHPTEAKRQTVLEHHRELYRCLVELENTMWTQSEREALQEQVAACLERLWRTGEIYLDKPSIADERRSVLHYLRHVFPGALAWTDRRLRAAWAQAGHDPTLLQHAQQLPRIALGNWVGGDRDGHPGVTANVTAQTLTLFRHTALNLIDEHLTRLAQHLSLSARRQAVPDSIQARVAALESKLGDHGLAARKRNPAETWRQLVNLLRASLPRDGAAPITTTAEALLDELQTLRNGLEQIGAERLVHHDVEPLIRHVQTFGFHLATIDVRQNSAFHDRALAQLLELAKIPEGADYPTWDEPRRRAMLDAELQSPRPFALRHDVQGTEARAVLDVFAVLAKHLNRHGSAGLGALIVSMTRSVEDLLAA
ncbi:MAG: phosphoenolpyruvate carboxylase [Myxococcota bacterium]